MDADDEDNQEYDSLQQSDSTSTVSLAQQAEPPFLQENETPPVVEDVSITPPPPTTPTTHAADDVSQHYYLGRGLKRDFCLSLYFFWIFPPFLFSPPPHSQK